MSAQFPVVTISPTGKIDPAILPPGISLLDGSGRVGIGYMPSRVPILDETTGLLPQGVMPAPVTINSTDFGFAGTLVVRSGIQYWLSPSVTIRPVRFSAVLGTIAAAGGTTGTDTTFRININGIPFATVTVPGSTRSATTTTFSQASIPPNSLLSIDITAVASVPSGSTTYAADAVIQLNWMQ